MIERSCTGGRHKPNYHYDFPIGLKIKATVLIPFDNSMYQEVTGIIAGVANYYQDYISYFIILDQPIPVSGSEPWLVCKAEGPRITPLTLGQFL